MSKHPYDPNKIRIISLNCNRSSNVVNTILHLALHSADLVLLQEPGFSDDAYVTTHPQFELLKPPRKSRKHNRAVAFVAKNNPFLTISQRPDLRNDPDLQVLEVSTTSIATTTILNIYNETEPVTNLYTIPRTLISIQLPERCIISGDMNAHHSWWNSTTKRPQRHEDLVPLMENLGYSLLNVPDVPTYYYRTGKGKSVIDLTFISPSLNDEARNWAVDEEAHTGSDHATIRFELVSQSALIHNPPTAPKYNWDKADCLFIYLFIYSYGMEPEGYGLF
jgi:exonuclease III